MNNNTPPQICPHCGGHLHIINQINKATKGIGKAPAHILGMFASGDAGVASSMPYRIHKKPIFELKADYFVFSGIVGCLISTFILGGSALVCYGGLYCITDWQAIGGAVSVGLLAGLVTLRFIDLGRYEVTEETKPQQVALAAPAPAPTKPAIHRVEVKMTRQNGRVSFQWFDLPRGITPKLLKRVGTTLQANQWRYSRPLLCDSYRVISQHKFHKLTGILKERKMVTTYDGNASYINGAGRAFFRSYLVDKVKKY